MKGHVVQGAYGHSQQWDMSPIPANPNRAARRAIQKQQQAAQKEQRQKAAVSNKEKS